MSENVVGLRSAPPVPDPKSPKLDDVASWESSTYSLNGKPGARYNPDTLVGRQGLKVYRRMRTDEQVKAVMQFKRDAITARGWSFVYDQASTLAEEERKKRIRVFTQIFQRIQGGFEDALNAILTGRDFGFSMTEKVTTEIEVDDAMYTGLSMLLTRDPCSFEFNTDDYGILIGAYQCMGGKRQELDMSRFIHYVHAPEFDRYFGRSDLREAYRPWFIKERIGDYWVLYLERFAGGFIVAKRVDGATLQFGSPEYNSLQTVLQNLHGASGIIPPKGVEIELLFPASTTSFETAMEYWDLAIAKAILVPNLLGLSHTGQTGAFAQSQTQLQAFIWTCKSDANRVQATLDDQLVKYLGDLNYGDGKYPQFKFNEMDIDFVKWLIENWTTMTGKVVISTEADETHIRKMLGMPERRPEDEPLVDPLVAEQDGRAADQQMFDQQMTTRQQDHTEEQAKRDAANEKRFNRLEIMFDTIMVHLTARDEPRSRVVPPTQEHNDPHSRLVPHGQLRSTTLEAFTIAASRVAFSVIERQQEIAAGRLSSDTAAIVARAVKRLLGNDQQLGALTDENIEDVASLEFSSAEKARLQAVYKRALTGAYDDGVVHARNELSRARGSDAPVLVRAPTTFASIRENAAKFFDVNSYRMAGNVSDATRAIIQQELQQSIKLGRSPEQTREAIWQRLLERGMTSLEMIKQTETDDHVNSALDELWQDSEETAAVYLDTLARTNLFEAMNEARYAEFTAPELDGFVEALEYSAVLDDRTTQICNSLDQHIYDATSDVWNEFRPPNHYNCRSLLIPVTQLDGWNGDESPPPTVQPQAGFGAGTK